MKKAGYNLADIASVTKHKDIHSLQRYLQKPSMEDREHFSTDLFNYTNNTDHDKDSDMSNFET